MLDKDASPPTREPGGFWHDKEGRGKRARLTCVAASSTGSQAIVITRLLNGSMRRGFKAESICVHGST